MVEWMATLICEALAAPSDGPMRLAARRWAATPALARWLPEACTALLARSGGDEAFHFSGTEDEVHFNFNFNFYVMSSG